MTLEQQARAKAGFQKALMNSLISEEDVKRELEGMAKEQPAGPLQGHPDRANRATIKCEIPSK